MNGQERIEKMFAFVIVDDDGTEGIPAIEGPNGMAMPLVGADMARVESLRPHALGVANSLNKEITVVEFSTRVEIETIKPNATDRQPCGCYTAPEGHKVMCDQHWSQERARA